MIKNNGYYEFLYGSHHYKNLQFIRKDHICETSYMTFKDPLNGEVFTFETDKIMELQFTTLMDIAVAEFVEPLAETAPHSLY